MTVTVSLRTSSCSSADDPYRDRTETRADLLRADIMALSSEYNDPKGAAGPLWAGWERCACPACEAIRWERWGTGDPEVVDGTG